MSCSLLRLVPLAGHSRGPCANRFMDWMRDFEIKHSEYPKLLLHQAEEHSLVAGTNGNIFAGDRCAAGHSHPVGAQADV